MSNHRALGRSILLVSGVVPLLLGGCTTEKLVFRDPFNPPPDNTFLGFFDVAAQQTTCGNCHVLHQRDWANTAHSGAISALVGNSDATAVCYQCHTVSERGNAVDGPAGYTSVQTDVYHNVQCESCHGPGLDHVQFPDAGSTATNPPLARISLPLNPPDSATLAQSASCGSCHNQNSGPGVRAYEEWEASGHSDVVREASGASPASNVASGCNGCHEAKGALAAWGVTANYVEKGKTDLLGQTCAVCHDPHGTAKDENNQPIAGQLRYSLSAADVNQNLCMKCHQRRSVPDQASSRGPHSPQGPMLLGDAGYQNPAYLQVDLQAVASTHGSERNPRLCAGCHVNRLSGTDVTTGKPAVSAGHLFLPTPCLDAGGLPDLANQDCPDDEASRSWQACTASGCHPSAAFAVNLFTLSSQRIEALVEPIWFDKNGNDAIDPDSTACSAGRKRIRVQGTPAVTDTIACANPTGVTADDDYNRANWDGGLLARTDRIPIYGPLAAGDPDTNQYKTSDNTITAAEGARFNVRMLREGGSDGSNGVHNPFLAEALLRANVAELGDKYFGGAPPLSASVRSIMNGPLGSVTKRPAAQWLIARPISSR